MTFWQAPSTTINDRTYSTSTQFHMRLIKNLICLNKYICTMYNEYILQNTFIYIYSLAATTGMRMSTFGTFVVTMLVAVFVTMIFVPMFAFTTAAARFMM